MFLCLILVLNGSDDWVRQCRVSVSMVPHQLCWRKAAVAGQVVLPGVPKEQGERAKGTKKVMMDTGWRVSGVHLYGDIVDLWFCPLYRMEKRERKGNGLFVHHRL